MSLLQMSFTGGILILAVIVIRALAINMLPKKAFNALWWISVVRLMIPFSIPSAFSAHRTAVDEPAETRVSIRGAASS